MSNYIQYHLKVQLDELEYETQKALDEVDKQRKKFLALRTELEEALLLSNKKLKNIQSLKVINNKLKFEIDQIRENHRKRCDKLLNEKKNYLQSLEV